MVRQRTLIPLQLRVTHVTPGSSHSGQSRAEQSTGQGLGEAENTTHARSFSQETEQNLSLNLENAVKETIK